MTMSMRIVATALALGMAHVAAAATTGTTPTRYSMPETEVWDLEAAHGETYRIFVSKPEGKAPEDGYPVLYVLDGNAMFAGFAEARRLQGVYDGGNEKIVIVGIGYPSVGPYDKRRMGDFTAPLRSQKLREVYREHPSGKRDAFERFLLDQLQPEIARRYAVDEERQTLFGHSLGGLFALHMAFSPKPGFGAFIAASPSIWWDDQAILAEEQAFRQRIAADPSLASHGRIMILAGKNEEARVTVIDSVAMAERLTELSAWGVRSEFELFPGETHMSVPSRAVTTALRYAMQQP